MENNEPPLLPASYPRPAGQARTLLQVSHTFRAEDEPRLLAIVGRLTLRLPFLIILAAVTPLFLLGGIAIATEELLPGALVALVGIGLVVRVVMEFQLRSMLKRKFQEAIRSSPSCSWVIDDEGLASTDGKEKMKWSSFSHALFCPEGLVLTGGAFTWIPKEAFANAEHLRALRPVLLKHRVRCEESA